MPEDDVPVTAKKSAAVALPLFYRKKTRSNGESDEISFGPCAVSIVRWLIILIIMILLVLAGARPTVLLHYLLGFLP